MDRQRLTRVGCFLFVWNLLSTGALANGVIRDGVGAISIGRGGTNIAFFGQHGGAARQPGGDCRHGRLRPVPSGHRRLDHRPLLLRSLYGGQRDDPTHGIAGVWIGPQVRRRRLGVGADHRRSRRLWGHFNLDDPVFGRESYTSFGALVKILPGLAWQVTDRLSVGGTLGVGFSSAKLDGPFYMQTGMLQGAAALVDVRANGACLVWSAGAQYDLSERTTIGIAYQSESRLEMTGSAEVDMVFPDFPSSEFDADLNLTWPRSVGVAWCT